MFALLGEEVHRMSRACSSNWNQQSHAENLKVAIEKLDFGGFSWRSCSIR